jgi:signal peptidase I
VDETTATAPEEAGDEPQSVDEHSPADAQPGAVEQPGPRGRRRAIELGVTVALALTLAFAVEALAVKPYRIPSPSMEPTLKPGQRVLVNRLEKRFGSFGVGDIVVFHPPAGAEQNTSSCAVRAAAGAACAKAIARRSPATFIKRIVAGPGDRLRIVDGRVIRNGRRASEPFIRPCFGGDPGCDRSTEITIPRGHYFVMGDNRGQSFDSRYWGSIPRDSIIGQAFASYWPPGRVGTL